MLNRQMEKEKSNIYISFPVKSPNKSWIMALTQIIDSMLLFSEKEEKKEQNNASPAIIPLLHLNNPL